MGDFCRSSGLVLAALKKRFRRQRTAEPAIFVQHLREQANHPHLRYHAGWQRMGIQIFAPFGAPQKGRIAPALLTPMLCDLTLDVGPKMGHKELADVKRS